MTAGTMTPYRSRHGDGPDGFAQLLHAEWTKLRTVRGWVIGLMVAALATVGLLLLGHDSCSTGTGAACTLPLGPGGEAVNDSFYFVRQPLEGNGSITVRMTSLTGLIPTGSAGGSRARAGTGNRGGAGFQGRPGLEPWSKAGIIVAANTGPGSAYAAMMITGAHGVRMQYDYTADAPGLAGAVSAGSPRWLRLTRSGDTITGYDSADGVRWTKVGTVRLAGLPPTAQGGMFAASPAYSHVISQSLGGSSGVGGPTVAIGSFDRVNLSGDWPSGAWRGGDIGGQNAMYPQAPGSYHHSSGRFTVTGSGDIAPDVPGSPGGGGLPISHALTGTFAGLIAVIVVATMFITAEYRRGLIRVSLAASPRRGRVLAAKAVVTGLAVFVVGLAGAAVALLAGQKLLRQGGSFIDPVSTLTEVRLVTGTAALFAVCAVLALAVGALLRHGAVAVTAVIVVMVAPWILGTILSSGALPWLFRVTPAAGFAIQGAYPKYPQVAASYTTADGYYPLAPWAGFAVLCAWAAAALALAVVLLRRRDA